MNLSGFLSQLSSTSSDSSMGSVQSDAVSTEQLTISDGIEETVATLAQVVLKKNPQYDIEALNQTLAYIKSHPVKLETTYKRNGEHRLTFKVLKEGTIVIHLKEQMNTGSFKTAKLACVIQHGHVKPAIKLTTKGLKTKRSNALSAKTEREMLKKFANRPDSRIIQLFAEVKGEDKEVLYQELGTEGELFDHIIEGKLTPKQKRQIFIDVLQGLVEAEEAGIAIRDVKAENVVLLWENGELRAKIIDLGLAMKKDEAYTLVGTPRYLAPEAWLQQSIRPNKLDTYAAGVFFNYLLPEPANDGNWFDGDRFMSLLNLRITTAIMQKSSNSAERLVGGLLHNDPAERLSPTEALELAKQLNLQDLSPA